MLKAIALAAAFAALAACADDKTAGPPQKRDGFIETDDGVGLYYVEKGSGSQTLIAPMALYLEPHLLDALSKNRRVIFYDPRNRGRSDAADLSAVSLDRQIEDLENLRAALGVEEMALLGWSGPGMETAVYAMRHPARVTRLIQMSPVPPAASIMRENQDDRNNRIDADALADIDARAGAGEIDSEPEAFCRRVNAATNPANFVDPALTAKVPDVCVYENEWPKNLWKYFGAFLPTFGDYDWREDIGDFTAPRLVLHGKEDGIPLAGAEAWVRGHDNARLIVLSPSGHMPFIEQRDAAIETIETFLNGDWPDNAETLN
ncbi:MAG TPA: alpha/beta hydrolase [Parvularculaceae bacterium]|nr:alpha/beta hydrolase [Parvularculaceae bacterium]